jgi:hypothetical protein
VKVSAARTTSRTVDQIAGQSPGVASRTRKLMRTIMHAQAAPDTKRPGAALEAVDVTAAVVAEGRIGA